MNNDPSNPFNWRMRTGPSIFAQDHTFRPKGDSGKSGGEIQSDIIARKVAKGETPGTIKNLGKHKEEKITAFREFPMYTKAKASKK